ncbi:MAG: hypothetical protein FJ382_07750 [Verrucomicrobia bacterium]|nr:hypothetical protein [Verrucomicrobiota bacterium]
MKTPTPDSPLRRSRCVRSFLPIGLLLFATFLSASAADRPPPPVVELGSRLELFFDDYLIDTMSGLRIQLNHPQSAGTAIAFDRPWEGNVSWPTSVFKDGDIYRMYYLGRSAPDYVRQAGLKPGETVLPAHPDFVCYAESKDGVTWVKPSLGLVEFNGSKDNNIVGDAKQLRLGMVFLDTNPATPAAERYKAVSSTRINKNWPQNLQQDPAEMIMSVSPDGLHWKKWTDATLLRSQLPNAFDGQNVLFWSTEEQQYVFYMRFMDQDIRTVARSTSKDLLHWTEPEAISFGDARMEHLYTNSATPYFRAPNLTLGFPKRYVPLRKRHEDQQIPGISEGAFMVTRDGHNWKLFGEAFIPPGRDDRNWIHRTTSTSVGIIPTADDEISLFVERHYTAPSNRIERFVIRTDGFTSLNADAQGGEFVTKPLRFKGENLVLNYATSASGSIRVEVQDVNGHPLPGFELERSVPLWGDEIEGTVRWERPEKAWTDPLKVSGLAEKPIRLRFVLRNADLYSLRFK